MKIRLLNVKIDGEHNLNYEGEWADWFWLQLDDEHQFMKICIGDNVYIHNLRDVELVIEIKKDATESEE